MRALVAETARRAKEVADILETVDDAAADDALATLTANNPELAEKARGVAKGNLRAGLIAACRHLETQKERERADLAEKVTHPSAGDLSPRFKCALYAAAVAGPICVALATMPLAAPLLVSVTSTLAGAVATWESAGCQPW